MSLRSPLSEARGLGAAKEGTHHWFIQRISAVAMAPLMLWLLFSLAALAGSALFSIPHTPSRAHTNACPTRSPDGATGGGVIFCYKINPSQFQNPIISILCAFESEQLVNRSPPSADQANWEVDPLGMQTPVCSPVEF